MNEKSSTKLNEKTLDLLSNSYIKNLFKNNPTIEEVIMEINKYGKPIISMHEKENKIINFLDAVTEDFLDEKQEDALPGYEFSCTVKIPMYEKLITTTGESILITSLYALIEIMSFQEESSLRILKEINTFLENN